MKEVEEKNKRVEEEKEKGIKEEESFLRAGGSKWIVNGPLKKFNAFRNNDSF